MPQLALAAASFTASAAPAIAATAAKATFMTTLKSVAMNVLTNVAISAAMSVLQPQVGAAGRPFEFVIDPDGPIPFAAGRIGVAGSVIHRDTFGPDLMFYGIPAVLSGAGPITAIESVKADDYPMAFDANGGATTEPYRQEFYFRSVLGEQPAPLALSTPAGLKNGAKLPGWGAAHKLSGKAAFLMVMAENSKGSAFPTGEVKPLVTLRGLKVYDPRKDSTYPGGSGTQRLHDPSTWTYSANPILWALKWCLGLWEGPNGKGAPQVDFQVGGIGAKPSGIDFPAFVAAANVADANGWTVAAYPNTDDDKSQVLDGFLQAGGCIYAQRAGKISCIQRAAPRASVVTISAADTAGPLEIDTAASRIDRINTLRPRFWSEAHRWQMTALDGEITAQAYRDEDGAARTRGLDFPFVSNARQCGQLAALQIANTREGIAGVIPLKPHLQRIRPGDAFTITEPGFVLNGLKCLCLNTDYDPATGVVKVSFVSETDAKYPFAMGQSPVAPEPPVLTPVDLTHVSPPLPEDWTIVVRPPAPGGGQLPGLNLTGIVSNSTATAIIVEYGSTAEGPWTQAYQGPPTVTSIPIDGLQPGATYFVAVQYQRDQNYSDRYVYGPYVAPALVSTDTTHLNGTPVTEITNRLQSVEAVAATAQQGVADLELVYGDTVSAAASAASAALDRAGAEAAAALAGASEDAAAASAVAAATAAGNAQGAANASAASASTASTKADEAAVSATASTAAKTAAETARGQAQTAATQAAASRDDAAGSAASASTAASNAATSRDQASGFATAASGSASTASTKANEAGNAAAAAAASQVSAASSYSASLAAAIAGFPDVLASDLLTAQAAGAPTTVPSLNPAWFSAAGITPGAALSGTAFYKQTVPWKSGEVYEFDYEVEGLTGASFATVYGQYLDASFTATTARTLAYVATPNGVKTRIVQRIALDRTVAGATTWTLAGTGTDRLRFGVIFNRTNGGGSATGQARLTRMTVRNVTAQVGAEQARDGAIVLGGNQGFEDGLTGWGPNSLVPPGAYNDPSGNAPIYYASYQGRSGVVVSAPGMGRRNLYSAKLFPIDTTRKYRVRTSVYVGPGAAARTYVGLRCLDAAGAFVGGNAGHQYVAIGGLVIPADSGWKEYVSDVRTGEGAGGFNPGTKLVQLVGFLDFDGLNGSSLSDTALDGIWLDDVTESENAKAQAAASATSAASAATSATNAGTSATAASGSATTAATKAGEASTFAGQASSSKDAAAGSASSAAASAVTASTASGTAATARDAAIGARNDAQAAAATATTQASSASAAAASASISANLAASIGTRSLNKNSIFADWTAALPATWSQWSGTAGTTYAKVAGINGSPNAVKVGSAAGDPAGIVQTGNGAFGATGGEYLVMEADVRLVSGSMVGAGLYVERYNAAGSAQTGAALTYNFATDKDASGVVRGAGVAGQTYRFSKLVDARAADTAQYVVFALTRFGGFGAAAAGEIEWRRASIRAATPEEIAAGVVLPGVEAQLAITAAVAADAQTRLSTVRFDVTGGAGGDPFEVALRADASGSLGMLSATALRFRNFIGGLAVDVMRMIDGYVHILGPLYIGPNREIEIEPFTPSINWSMGTARLAIGKLPNDNLLFWFGPNVTAANMRKNNAALWLDRGGSAYFGGTLSAGVLRNGLTVTSLASNTTADTGRFGSNGGTITTTLSYSAATSAVYYDGATSPLPRPADTNGATSAAVRLDRSINGGALTAVQTLNVSGTWSDTVPVDGYVQGQGWRHEYSATMGGSLTYTDPQAVAQDRQYKATITARADGPRPIGSQTLSVVCIEA